MLLYTTFLVQAGSRWRWWRSGIGSRKGTGRRAAACSASCSSISWQLLRVKNEGDGKACCLLGRGDGELLASIS